MADIHPAHSENGNGNDLSREDIQAEFAKAVEPALPQGNSPDNMRFNVASSPVSCLALSSSGQDYPVFTPILKWPKRKHKPQRMTKLKECVEMWLILNQKSKWEKSQKTIKSAKEKAELDNSFNEKWQMRGNRLEEIVGKQLSFA